MNEDIFDQMVEALNGEKVQDPLNLSIHKMENRWNLWQKTFRSWLFKQILSKETIEYQPLFNVQTVDEYSVVNLIYQNIVKPKFVWTTDGTDEIQNLFNNNDFCWKCLCVEPRPQTQKFQQQNQKAKTTLRKYYLIY